MRHRVRSMTLFVAVVGLLACTALATGGGGNVLPSSAKPKGYSLSQIAAATAVYNSGTTSGNPATPPPPDVPFEILAPPASDFTVSSGTMIYLPIFFWDDSGGAPPGFPTDITDQAADAAFLNSQALDLYGITAFIVQVDGETTVLDDSYIVGVTTPPLLDGTPPGTHYIISAAFLTPLTPGVHTVALGGIVGGEPVAFISYNVTVTR
jgi:hypothetical protein